MKDISRPGRFRDFFNSVMRLEWSGRSRLALIALLSIPISWAAHEFPFLALEAELYDLRVRFGSTLSAKPSPGVTVIAIDDHSARALDDFLPLGLENEGRIVQEIARRRPRVLGVLLGHEGTALESRDAVAGLHRSLLRAEESGTPVLLGTGFDVMGERLPPYPLSSLPHAVALLHKDGNVFSEDKVARRALIRLYGRNTFSSRLAELAVDSSSDTQEPARLRRLLDEASYRLPQIQADYVFFGYDGNPTIAQGRGEPSHPVAAVPFRWHTAAELLAGKVPAEDLRDRVVILGSMNLEDSRDFVATPYSRKTFATPKLAIHAQIVSSLLSRDLIRPIPPSLELLAIWLLTVGSLILVSGAAPALVPSTLSKAPRSVLAPGSGAPGPSLLAAFALAVAFAMLNGLFFTLGRIWIPAASPLLASMIASYLVLPFRLMREYSARWEIEEKNAVLRQVDELKRNFLSLVTHDLKTPVARIQGLAETLQRRQSRSSENPELVNNMLDAAEELNRFITSILDLNRIDSQPPRLRIESKDINRVIEDVIRRHEPLARRRGMTIAADLEPLFPVRMDVELISKVLSNLVDNAIKYSGDGRNVTIRSREQDGRVRVSVEDEGVGMSDEETRRLFTRFFRAKNERTAGIAGSGLGLHLARYFVELHEGNISVESRPGEGSRFHIELPVEGPAGIAANSPAHSGLTRMLRDAAGNERKNEEQNHA